jgi:hypothetical protein
MSKKPDNNILIKPLNLYRKIQKEFGFEDSSHQKKYALSLLEKAA